MNTQNYSEQEWQTLHDEIQKRFRALAADVAPTAQPRYGKTVTKLFPLFSHMSFSRAESSECNEIIVGIDIGPEDGQWRIDADISDEEEGTIYFEVPRTPFLVATFAELQDRVLRAVDQLINEGRPALMRLLTSAVPAPVPLAANLPDVARNF